jgi:hypothetical protein
MVALRKRWRRLTPASVGAEGWILVADITAPSMARIPRTVHCNSKSRAPEILSLPGRMGPGIFRGRGGNPCPKNRT